MPSATPKLWDAINAYVMACGGDPSRHVYGNTPRQAAVAQIEGIHGTLVAALQEVIGHVEDPNVVRRGNWQCTLCYTFRTKIRAALKLAGLREHAGTWITEDEDRRISADGP